MIYLLINDGKDDAQMIPMSSVESLIKVDGGSLIVLRESNVFVAGEKTLDVQFDNVSERETATKIYKNFSPKKI